MKPKIYGFNKSSEAGGNAFNASVFLKGCNMRCPYCMNCRLVTGNLEPIALEPVEQFIKESKPEMVMISGGEPFMDFDNLEATISWLMDLGCKIGISTNGLTPSFLRNCLSDLSYVALDVKGLPEFYMRYAATDTKFGAMPETAFFRVLESWKLLRQTLGATDFSYEIRTTLYPATFKAHETSYDYVPWMFLGQLFIEGEKWVLQEFRPTAEMMSENAKEIEPLTAKQLEMLLNAAQYYAKQATVELRNV